MTARGGRPSKASSRPRRSRSSAPRRMRQDSRRLAAGALQGRLCGAHLSGQSQLSGDRRPRLLPLARGDLGTGRRGAHRHSGGVGAGGARGMRRRGRAPCRHHLLGLRRGRRRRLGPRRRVVAQVARRTAHAHLRAQRRRLLQRLGTPHGDLQPRARAAGGGGAARRERAAHRRRRAKRRGRLLLLQSRPRARPRFQLDRQHRKRGGLDRFRVFRAPGAGSRHRGHPPLPRGRARSGALRRRGARGRRKREAGRHGQDRPLARGRARGCFPHRQHGGPAGGLRRRRQVDRPDRGRRSRRGAGDRGRARHLPLAQGQPRRGGYRLGRGGGLDDRCARGARPRAPRAQPRDGARHRRMDSLLRLEPEPRRHHGPGRP